MKLQMIQSLILNYNFYLTLCPRKGKTWSQSFRFVQKFTHNVDIFVVNICASYCETMIIVYKWHVLLDSIVRRASSVELISAMKVTVDRCRLTGQQQILTSHSTYEYTQEKCCHNSQLFTHFNERP